MKYTYSLLIVVLFLSLTYPVIIKSQETEADLQSETRLGSDTSFPPKDLEIYEVLETLRESHLIQELQLSEEKAQTVIEKIRDTRKLRKRYLFRRYTIENELDTLLDFPTPDQTKINNALRKLEIAKLQYYQQMMEADEELWKMFTPKERAKYVLFQRNFNKTLKEIIASIRKQSSKTITKPNQIIRRQNTESVIRRHH